MALLRTIGRPSTLNIFLAFAFFLGLLLIGAWYDEKSTYVVELGLLFLNQRNEDSSAIVTTAPTATRRPPTRKVKMIAAESKINTINKTSSISCYTRAGLDKGPD